MVATKPARIATESRNVLQVRKVASRLLGLMGEDESFANFEAESTDGVVTIDADVEVDGRKAPVRIRIERGPWN